MKRLSTRTRGSPRSRQLESVVGLIVCALLPFALPHPAASTSTTSQTSAKNSKSRSDRHRLSCYLDLSVSHLDPFLLLLLLLLLLLNLGPPSPQSKRQQPLPPVRSPSLKRQRLRQLGLPSSHAHAPRRLLGHLRRPSGIRGRRGWSIGPYAEADGDALLWRSHHSGRCEGWEEPGDAWRVGLSTHTGGDCGGIAECDVRWTTGLSEVSGDEGVEVGGAGKA